MKPTPCGNLERLGAEAREVGARRGDDVLQTLAVRPVDRGPHVLDAGLRRVTIRREQAGDLARREVVLIERLLASRIAARSRTSRRRRES